MFPAILTRFFFSMSFAAPVHPMPLTVMMKMNPSTQTEQEKNDMIRAMSLGPKHRALNTVRYETDTLSKIVLSRIPANRRTSRFAESVGYDRHQWCFYERSDHFFGARVDGHAIVLGAVVLVWAVRRVWFGVGGAAGCDRVTRGTWC